MGQMLHGVQGNDDAGKVFPMIFGISFLNLVR